MAAQSVRTPTLLLLARPMTDGWSPLCNFTFFEPDDAEAISADKPRLLLSTGRAGNWSRRGFTMIAGPESQVVRSWLPPLWPPPSSCLPSNWPLYAKIRTNGRNPAGYRQCGGLAWVSRESGCDAWVRLARTDLDGGRGKLTRGLEEESWKQLSHSESLCIAFPVDQYKRTAMIRISKAHTLCRITAQVGLLLPQKFLPNRKIPGNSFA